MGNPLQFTGILAWFLSRRLRFLVMTVGCGEVAQVLSSPGWYGEGP